MALSEIDELPEDIFVDCLSREAQLTNYKTDYNFRATRGQISVEFLNLGDTLGGACLDNWHYEFTASEEPDVETDFD